MKRSSPLSDSRVVNRWGGLRGRGGVCRGLWVSGLGRRPSPGRTLIHGGRKKKASALPRNGRKKKQKTNAKLSEQRVTALLIACSRLPRLHTPTHLAQPHSDLYPDLTAPPTPPPPPLPPPTCPTHLYPFPSCLVYDRSFNWLNLMRE